jgi:hypothetical protein
MIRLLANPLPLPSPVSKLSLHLSLPVELTEGRGWEGGGRGAKSYDHEEAWLSINYSILSGLLAGSETGSV